MNEKNYDYLKNQVKFAGFGESLEQPLRDKMAEQKTEFSLPHETRFGEDQVSSSLHFKKSKESELYFFNSFELSMKKPGQDEALRQTYFVGKENNLTLKERYNMLDNRAVFKEFSRLEQVGEGEKARFKATDETYKAWAVLNFKETDATGNFLIRKLFWDHEKTLAKFPVKELGDNYDRARMVASLEKGNLQKATLIQDGQETKVLIAANPINKSFDFYDNHMNRLEVRQAVAHKEEQSQNHGKQQHQNQNASETNKQETQIKQRRNTRLKVV